MKTALTPRLVNGPFGDPGLFVSLRWQGRALQLDLGRMGRMDPGEVLKISHVFISHAHMDHFMGFDHLLRLFLPRDAVLHLYGPKDFLARLGARLAGYTWNLTEEYALRMIGHEVTPERVVSTTFRASTGFAPEDRRDRPFDRVLLEEPAFEVRTAILDHKIPCLAFAVCEKAHLNVDPATLDERRFRPGRWLDQLKRAIRAGEADERPIAVLVRENGEVTEKPIPLGSLRELVISSKGQKIGYVVDTLFSESNQEKIVELVRGADVFYCESPFLEEDVEQASKRYHLTARQAGLLGREAGVRRLEVFHFSPRYEGRADEIYA
ncbi:MAG: ribonuclease Z, partial [Candidatus Binatia bacterium]